MGFKKYALTLLYLSVFFSICNAMNCKKGSSKRSSIFKQDLIPTKNEIDRAILDFTFEVRSEYETKNSAHLDTIKKAFFSLMDQRMATGAVLTEDGRPPLFRSKDTMILQAIRKNKNAIKNRLANDFIHEEALIIAKRIRKNIGSQKLIEKKEHQVIKEKQLTKDMLKIIEPFNLAYGETALLSQRLQESEKVLSLKEAQKKICSFIKKLLSKIILELPKIKSHSYDDSLFDDDSFSFEDYVNNIIDEHEEKTNKKEELDVKEPLSYMQTVTLKKIDTVVVKYGLAYPDQNNDFYYEYANTYNQILILLYNRNILEQKHFELLYPPSIYNKTHPTNNYWKSYFDPKKGDLKIYSHIKKQ
ncbi:MAG: hypothetical protein ACTSXG_03900 [Alphaproteobacteria bacterium]